MMMIYVGTKQWVGILVVLVGLCVGWLLGKPVGDKDGASVALVGTPII